MLGGGVWGWRGHRDATKDGEIAFQAALMHSWHGYIYIYTCACIYVCIKCVDKMDICIYIPTRGMSLRKPQSHPNTLSWLWELPVSLGQVTNESNPASFEGGKCCSLWCHRCQQRCQCQQLQGCGIRRKPCSRGCSCCKCLFPTGSSANTWCFPSVPWLKHFQTFGCWRNLGEFFESTGFNIKICSSFHGLMEPVLFHLNSEPFGFFKCSEVRHSPTASRHRLEAPVGDVLHMYEEISVKYHWKFQVVNFQNLVCKTCTFVRTSLPIDWGFCPESRVWELQRQIPVAVDLCIARYLNFFELFVQNYKNKKLRNW